MAQEQIQIQEQKQLQVQRLSQQQMLQVKLLEMPLTELEESVNAELDDNPALEKRQDEGELNEISDSSEANNDDFEAQQEQQERQDALDKALERMGDDDELPVYATIMLTTKRLCMAIQHRLSTNSTNKWAKESLAKGRKLS